MKHWIALHSFSKQTNSLNWTGRFLFQTEPWARLDSIPIIDESDAENPYTAHARPRCTALRQLDIWKGVRKHTNLLEGAGLLSCTRPTSPTSPTSSFERKFVHPDLTYCAHMPGRQKKNKVMRTRANMGSVVHAMTPRTGEMIQSYKYKDWKSR